MKLPRYTGSQRETNDRGTSSREQLKPVVGWVALANLLIASASSFARIAQENHLLLHRSVLGFALFLVPVGGGLACLGMALRSLQRASRARTSKG
jgi:hypothetical protein